MVFAKDSEGQAISVSDLAQIAAPLQLFPGWLPDDPAPIVGESVIHDIGRPVPEQVGGVLLLVGARPSQPETAEAVREAGRHAYACVVVKALDEDISALARVAEETEVALLVAPDETPWRDVDRLVGTLVSAQGSQTPAYAQVRPGDLFALANAIAHSVGGATAIEDHTGRMFAHSSLPHQQVDEVRLQAIKDRVTAPHEGDTEKYLQVRNATKPLWFARHRPEHPDRLAMPVRSGGELLGMIWVLDGDPPLKEGAHQALEDAAAVTALHLLQLRQQENGRRWQRGEVLGSLLQGRLSAGVASALIGLPVGTPSTVLAIATRDPDEPSLLGVARTIDLVNLYCEAWHPLALGTAIDDKIYALLPTPTSGQQTRGLAKFARDISDTVRRTNGVTLRIGIGPMVDTLESVPESRRLAELTLSAIEVGALDVEEREPPVATLDEVRSRVILRELATRGVLDLNLPGDWLDDVLAHDRERNTTYGESLLAYFDAFGDMARAARALSIHENTLRYRLRRVQEQFPVDLDDPNNLLIAWLQLRLAALS